MSCRLGVRHRLLQGVYTRLGKHTERMDVVGSKHMSKLHIALQPTDVAVRAVGWQLASGLRYYGSAMGATAFRLLGRCQPGL